MLRWRWSDIEVPEEAEANTSEGTVVSHVLYNTKTHTSSD